MFTTVNFSSVTAPDKKMHHRSLKEDGTKRNATVQNVEGSSDGRSDSLNGMTPKRAMSASKPLSIAE